jgi:hypothetical protein
LFECLFALAPCGKQRCQSERINRYRHYSSLGTFRTFEDRYGRITKTANAEAGCEMTAADAKNAPPITNAGGQRAANHNSSRSAAAPGLNDTTRLVGLRHRC